MEEPSTGSGTRAGSQWQLKLILPQPLKSSVGSEGNHLSLLTVLCPTGKRVIGKEKYSNKSYML